MPKVKISEYSTVNSNNTDINSINIDEGCAPSGINNAIREVMVHLKNWQTNASGDGATFASLVVQGTGSFTGAVTMSAGATLSGTNTLSGSTVMAASAGTSASPSIYFSGDTNTGIFSPAADTIAFAEGGAEAMRIDSSGNVGIGTTSPSDILHVGNSSRTTRTAVRVQTGNAYANATSVSYANALSSVGGKFAFDGTANGYVAQIGVGDSANLWIGSWNNSATDGSIQFITGNNTTSTERMRINSSGQVGIGTNNPTDRLTVSDGTTNVAVNPTGGVFYFGPTTNHPTIFITNNTERARITSGGDLLVGHTTNPSNMKLLVNGVGEFTTSTSSNDTTGWAGVDLNTVGAISISRNGSNVMAFFHTSNASGLSGSPVGTISITTTATTYSTSSDYRLKENIEPMTGALATVAQLKPVTYTWKVNGSAGQGFIAHELQAVVPDCVTGEKDATEIKQVKVSDAIPATYDEDGNELTPAVEAVYEEREVPKYQGVDTSFLVATLTAAIQELKAITDAQATRIEALEAEVAAMKAGNGN